MKTLKLSLISLILLSCGAPDNSRNDSEENPGNETRTERVNTIENPVTSSLTQAFRNTYDFMTNEELAKFLKKENQTEVVLVPKTTKHTNDQRTKENMLSPQKECGLEENTSVISKIEDCKTKNDTTAKFSANIQGMMGEVDWSLVFKKTDGDKSLEIWQDSLTGALWSYAVTSITWDNLFERSESSICSLNRINGENLLKSIKEVQWRVPTHKDLAAAEINGLSYALRGLDIDLWSMTTNDANDKEALLFSLKGFSFKNELKSNPHSVMCMGHIL